MQLRASAKISNLNEIQSFQNITQRKITNPSPYTSNNFLDEDLLMETIKEETINYYKWFHQGLNIHPNPLIKILPVITIPGTFLVALSANGTETYQITIFKMIKEIKISK